MRNYVCLPNDKKGIQGMTRKELLKKLTALKPELQARFGIERIVLFGSFARDEATPESDVDLLIKTAKKSFRNRREAARFLRLHLQREVDLGYEDTLHPFIRRDIKNEVIFV
jgi:predicted nucleotidyltransferase